VAKSSAKILVQHSHESFALVSIGEELYFFDLMLQKVAKVVLPSGNSPSLVEIPKPVSVSPRSGISTIVDRKDK
jgi:hypothetical protein